MNVNSTKNGQKNNLYLILLCVFLLVVGIGGYFLFGIDKQKTLNVKVVSSGNEATGCHTLYTEYDSEIYEYSFNNGLTWQNSNYGVVCDNGETVVLGKNKDDEIIARGTLKITELNEEAPKINVDFDVEADSLDEKSLLNGVRAFDNKGNDLTENLVVETKVSDDNELLIVKYSVSDILGNVTSVERNYVYDNLIDVFMLGTVSYSQNVYTCSPGEKINALVEASLFFDSEYSVNNEINFPTVKSYKSSNKSVATVVKNPNVAVKTSSAVALQINCIKPGETTLTAMSSTGATTTSKVIVKNEIMLGKLEYEFPVYTLSVGDKLTVNVSGVSNRNNLLVKSGDSDIVIPSKLTYSSTSNDKASFTIEGLKAGTTYLTLSDPANGENVVVKVIVKDCIMEFGSNNYNLTTGVRLLGTVTSKKVDGSYCEIESVKSSNEKVVSVIKDSVNSNGKYMFYLYPVKAGKVTLTATCISGKKITATATVTNKKVVKFTNSNYELSLGDDLYITLASLTSNGKIDDVVKLETNPNNIVDVELKGVVSSRNTIGINLIGKKVGSTTLTITTKSGAKATTNIVVSDKDKGTISFNKPSYSCNVGEKIDAAISANASIDGNSPVATVKSYSVSDPLIATIEKHPSYTIKSMSMQAIQITCLRAGEVTLNAESNLGATTNVKLKVNITSDFAFEKTSYSIEKGKSISVKLYGANKKGLKITSSNGNVEVGMISYSKSNPSEANVTLTGVKAGTSTITATTSSGLIRTIKVTVSDPIPTVTMNFGTNNYKMTVGEKLLGTVTSQYVNGKTCKVTSITSSDTNVATITYDKKFVNNKYEFYINAKKVGTTTLTATCESGKKVTSTVTVSAASKGTIAFDKTSYTCNVGDEITTVIKASHPTDVGVKVKSYSSSDTKIATITKHPTIVADSPSTEVVLINCLKAGEVTLTATSTKGATASVKVKVNSKKLGFEKTAYSVEARKSISVKLYGANEVSKITSSSTGVKVGTVSYSKENPTEGTLNLTGIHEGTFTITVTYNNGKEYTTKVTVIDDGYIDFDKTSYTCNAGEKITATILASHFIETVKVKSYSSSDPKIATITKHPTIVADSPSTEVVLINCLKAGEVTLTATSSKGVKTSVKLKVNKENFGFEKSSYNIETGKSISVKLYGANKEGLKVTSNNSAVKVGLISYSKSNPSEGIVTLTGVKAGTATITAKTSSGSSSSIKVTVSDPIPTVTMNFGMSNYKITVGEKLLGTVTSQYVNGKTCKVTSITSSDTNVATITYDKKFVNNKYEFYINAKKAGTATLTATCESGKKVTSTVTVSAASKGTIAFDKTSYTCNVGDKITTVIKASHPTDVGVKVKSYSSSNTSIATVTDDETYTIKTPSQKAVQINCLRAGTVTLTATSTKGATTTSSLKVNVTSDFAFEKTSYNVEVGKTISVKLYGANKEGLQVTSTNSSVTVGFISYSKSNPSEASISLKGEKIGTATIKATTASGLVRTIKVNVVEPSKDMDIGNIDLSLGFLNDVIEKIKNIFDEL